ncbi:hypothetical protein ACIPSA_49295 [Streptomyces sp. NPDC086549]|uniref:hypothetical protein n=1 Tax=Streptomyces sp. NPDC086549 TaxID=3365752 RepID=UPI0038300634
MARQLGLPVEVLRGYGVSREQTWTDHLRQHGWEVDPTVYMAGTRGPTVQVRRIGGPRQDGEAGC